MPDARFALTGFLKLDLLVAHYLGPAVLVHPYRMCLHSSRRGLFRNDSISERGRKNNPISMPRSGIESFAAEAAPTVV
jgi:hypothetical protein